MPAHPRPVLLVTPPLVDPRSPHLGCAMLAAHLARHGRDARILDLNVRAIEWLLRGRSLSAAIDQASRLREHIVGECRARVRAGGTLGADDVRNLVRAGTTARATEQLPALAADAFDTLRDPERFYDPAAHRAARRTIDTALDVVAFACDSSLRVSVANNQRYSSRYDVSRLEDVLAATCAPRGTPFREFYEQVAIPQILAANPLMVGISIANVHQAIPGLALARLLRDLGRRVIVGGTFFSKFARQIERLPAFFDMCDAVVTAEGEAALLALAEAGDQPGAIEQIPNVAWRDRSQVRRNPVILAPEVPDPGAADFRSLDLSAYLVPEPVLPIYAGKGCPWSRCTFCGIPQVNRDFGRKRRTRDPRRIAEEMRVQAQRHGAHRFVFTDESVEPAMLERVAQEISQLRLDVDYLAFTRFGPAWTPELFRRLASSGCRKLLFGLESGSQKVNDACDKGVDLATVRAQVEACQDANIAVHIFSIVGLPHESAEDFEQSRAFMVDLASALRMPASSFVVVPFYLNWNSALRDHAVDAGIEYDAGADFPVQVPFAVRGGPDAAEAARRAVRVEQEITQQCSSARFPLDYTNPLWPGWEEYAVLYAARYGDGAADPRFSWPRSLGDLLTRTVRPARHLASSQLPEEFLPLLAPFGHDATLVLAPSADPAIVAARVAAAVAADRPMRVRDLIADCAGGMSRPAIQQTLSQILQLIAANLLEWQ